jgi:hypothetical protein
VKRGTGAEAGGDVRTAAQGAPDAGLGETDEAFYRRDLGRALQSFKQHLWDLPKEARDRIASDLRERIETYRCIWVRST